MTTRKSWTAKDIESAKERISGRNIKLDSGGRSNDTVVVKQSAMNTGETRQIMYIGIDPDVQKSGVAIKMKGQNDFETICLDLPDLFDLLENSGKIFDLRVNLEAGWLNKKVNYRKNMVARAQREYVAAKVGRNHEIGRQIEIFCRKKSITCTLIRPTMSKVVNADEFNRLTGHNKKTNQEQRDAAMLVWGL